jgi:Tol biopolymer transport system component
VRVKKHELLLSGHDEYMPDEVGVKINMMCIRYVIFTILTSLVLNAQEQLHDVHLVVSARDLNLRGELINISISPVAPHIISFESVEGGNMHRLWWYDIRAQHLEQVTPRPGEEDDTYWNAQSDRNVNWCPVEINGKNWFLFVSSGLDGQENIYLGNTGSRQYLRLTGSASVDHHPRWAPDGNSFVYVSSRSGSGDIYLVNNVKDLIRRFERIARQSPQMREIVIEGLIAGENTIRLTENPEMDTFPDWSPDGRFIVYQGLNRVDDILNMDLFLIDLHQSSPKPVNILRNPQVDAIQPRWSYDQNYIAFYASPSGGEGEVPFHVFLSYIELNADTATGKINSSASRGNVDVNIRRNSITGPLWGPGSRSLLYVKGEGSYTPILMYSTMRSSNAMEAHVLRDARFDVINREIAGYISRERAMVIFLTYEDQDYRIYRARPGGGILTRRLNDVYLQPIERTGGFNRSSRTVSIGGQAVTMLNQINPSWSDLGFLNNLFFEFTILPYITHEHPYEIAVRTSFGSVRPMFRSGGERVSFSYSIVDVSGVALLPLDNIINRTALYAVAGVGYIVDHTGVGRPTIGRRINWPFGFGLQYSVSGSFDILGQVTFRNVYYSAQEGGVFSTARTHGFGLGLKFGF